MQTVRCVRANWSQKREHDRLLCAFSDKDGVT